MQEQFDPPAPVTAVDLHDDGQYWYQLDNGSNTRYPESSLYNQEEFDALTLSDNTPKKGLMPLADLLSIDMPPMKFLVDGMLARGHLAMLGGRPKSGKSWLALQMAKAIDTGKPFLDRKTIQTKILYIALEDGQRRVHQRCKILKWQPKNTDVLFEIANFNGVGFSKPGKGLQEIEAYAPQYGLIIIDTLIATLSSKANENDNAQMGAIVNELARIAHDNDTAILLIHHTGKGYSDSPFDMLRGASALRGAYDVGFVLERKQDEREAVLHAESRDMDLDNMTIKQAKNGTGWEYKGNGKEIENIRAGRKMVEVMLEHGDGVTVSELAKLTGKSAQTIHNQLVGAEKNGDVYRQTDPNSDSSTKPADLWFVSDEYK